MEGNKIGIPESLILEKSYKILQSNVNLRANQIPLKERQLKRIEHWDNQKN
jgi:hypothetical protein